MYFYEDPAAQRVMTRYLQGLPVAPKDARLAWRTSEIRSRNHRGEYHLYMRDNYAHAYFYPYKPYEEIGCEYVLAAAGSDAVRDVELACDAHAAALPPYPFLFDWPALASEDLANA